MAAQLIRCHIVLTCNVEDPQTWLEITQSFIPAHLPGGKIRLAKKVLQGSVVCANHKVFTLQIVSEMPK